MRVLQAATYLQSFTTRTTTTALRYSTRTCAAKLSTCRRIAPTGPPHTSDSTLRRYCTRSAPQKSTDAMSSMEGPWGAWQAEPAKFTKLVVDSMKELYPEELADKSWDNVGLLVGNHELESGRLKPIVLVTNDLTYQVAVDAIAQGASVIVSYHPFIFSGLKSITDRDPQQSTLIMLMQAGVAVYCPHTAVDAAPEGLNSWLADVVAGPNPTTRSVAVPCASAPEGFEGAGYGVIARFVDADADANIKTAGTATGEDETCRVPLSGILHRLAAELGNLGHVMVASPVGTADVGATRVGSFAVCAGSGCDVLRNADVDLVVTGEAGHHAALRAVQLGRTLVQVFHSNSERGYLHQVLGPRLEERLRRHVAEARVVFSRFDEDPFRIVEVGKLEG